LSYGYGIIKAMENGYVRALDEYFAAQYSDYVKLSALDGYVMPEVVFVGADGNIDRRDSQIMRLCHQKNCGELLKKFKAGLADVDFTFHFAFRSFRDKTRDPFRKYTFAKLLPACLERAGETAESAGEKLDIQPKIWRSIVKGKVYPEKNTVIALALTCGLTQNDTKNLFAVCGFSFSDESVRDVVCEYLIKQRIFNPEMRDACLAEYKITNLPIKQ